MTEGEVLAVVSDVSEAARRRLPVQCHRNVHAYVDGRFLQAGGHLQEAARRSGRDAGAAARPAVRSRKGVTVVSDAAASPCTCMFEKAFYL